MIKRDKIDKLAYEKIIKSLESYLLGHNYLYKKTKEIFVRTFGDYEHIITIEVPKYESLDYNNETEELKLNFNISFSIVIPQFETWFENKVKKKTNWLQVVETIKGYTCLDIIEDIDKKDFYSIPYNNNVVKYTESDVQKDKDRVELELFIQNGLKKEIDNLLSKSDINSLFVLNKYPMATNTIGLLTYGGFNEKAISLLDSRYEREIEFMNEKKLSNDNVSYFTKNFTTFIQDAFALQNIKYHNPFDSEIICVQGTGTELKFTEKSIYRETLKVPKTEISIQRYLLNPNNGDFILYLDDDRALKFNSKGEKLLEFKPVNHKKYCSTWHFSIGYIDGTDCFFVNNCIITQNNEIVYILKEKWNNKQLIAKNITFSAEENAYFVESKIIAGRVLPDVIECALTADFKTIVIQEQINNTDYLTNEISKFKNGKLVKSKSGNYAIWFGNGTKSTLLDLKKHESKVIFGHPTSIKDYIQNVYPNCPNNFDLTNSTFADDDTYLVASALYGKLVAWKLPNLERIELVPNSEAIQKIEYGELITVGKQSFFKWSNGTFGAYILEVHILQNSEIFISQTEKLTLIWNNKFENIGHLEDIGRIKVHSDRYLTQLIDNELRIYELI